MSVESLSSDIDRVMVSRVYKKRNRKSYYGVVELATGEVWSLTPAIRDLNGGEAREEAAERMLIDPAGWPVGSMVQQESSWQQLWQRVISSHENPTRTAEGTRHMREHAGGEWRGSVDAARLAADGFCDLGCIAEGGEDDGQLLKDLEVMKEMAEGAGKQGRTHGAVYDSSTRSLLLIDPEARGLKGERPRAAATDYRIPRTAQVAAYNRMVRRVQRAVGKAGVRPMVEIIMPLKARGSKKALLSTVPPWHGDFKKRRRRGVAGRGLDFTMPSLAVTVMLTTGVPTLFPNLTDERTQSRGVQPKAEEDIEDYESGTGGIFRGRAARWKAVYDGGTNFGDATLAIGAGGASVGETAGGRARSCPTRAGLMSRTCTVVRPTMERGHALAFDATGPHRGPGVAAGETGTPRVAMYFSFASSSLQAEGAAPVFALKDGLKGRLDEDYHLAFDSNGVYQLGGLPPSSSVSYTGGAEAGRVEG